MNDRPDLQTHPRMLRGFDFGLLGAIAFALVYGFLADPIGLTWGLIAPAFVAGMVIGGSIARGAWGRQPHVRVRRLQVLSVGIAFGSWIGGIFFAYLFSQVFFPQATTQLLERVSPGGFAAYFTGLDERIRLLHAGGLVAIATAAWRWAR